MWCFRAKQLLDAHASFKLSVIALEFSFQFCMNTEAILQVLMWMASLICHKLLGVSAAQNAELTGELSEF